VSSRTRFAGCLLSFILECSNFTRLLVYIAIALCEVPWRGRNWTGRVYRAVKARLALPFTVWIFGPFNAETTFITRLGSLGI